MGVFTPGLSHQDIIDLIESVNIKKEHSPAATESHVLIAIKELGEKIEANNQNLNKLISMISKMYQENEINKDTFNRLDQFLHDWLDSSKF